MQLDNVFVAEGVVSPDVPALKKAYAPDSCEFELFSPSGNF